MNILFLGKYDKSMHLLEEEILNIQKNTSPNQTHKLEYIPTYNKLAEPDVKKYPINNCDVWVILGNVKPTLLLKQLISQANILLFIFNFTNLETLAFLTEGWGPIVKKAGIPKPENQKRILIGTQCNSSIKSKDIINKIQDAMENLGCEAFCVHGTRIKNEKIGSYIIIHDLITYIKEQIQEKQPESSILDESDESNKTIGDNIKNEDLDNKQKEELADEKNQTKIEIELENNVLMNLILKENTAEILNVQNTSNNFIVPLYVHYKNKEYIITNICDSAFKDSNIVRLSFVKESQVKRIGNYAFQQSTISSLSLPASLEILGEFWCAEANDLSQISVDEGNLYFKCIKNFLINYSTSEILFAPRYLIGDLLIPGHVGNTFFYNTVNFGNYSYYGARNLQNIRIKSDEIYIGDFCFSNASNLNSIQITCKKKLKIGKNCFGNCCSLSNISIQSESVDDLIISMDTFYNCKLLIDITFDSKSKLILENDIFSCNDKLEKVYLKGSSVIIGDRCFKDSFTKEKYKRKYYKIEIIKKLKIESESNVEIGKNCFEGSNIDNFEISGVEVSLKEESFSNCSLLTYFKILNATKVLIEGFSFKNCSKLNTISLNKIGFVSIKPHALLGCHELENFYLKLSLIYDAWNDYDIKSIPLKTGNSNNLFISQKKGTEELYVFKQLQEKKYDEYISNFTKQIIALSKNNDSIISDFCGLGLIKLNSISERCLIIMTRYYNKGSLDDVFSKKVQLSDTQKYILILGITYEMKLLHSYHLHYPNLPPEKILIDENYYPHLNVFGYSKQSEPTIYTAPEVLLNMIGRNQKSDIYSYSLIIYELITGEKPYNSIKSINDIIKFIPKFYRPDFKYVKDKIIQVFLNRCWSNIASNRPDFNEIFNEITKECFISLFNVNEEEVYKYMKLLKIPEFTEAVKSDYISYELLKRSKTAKITKVDNHVENFQLAKSYKGEKTEYSIVEICDHAFSNCFKLKSIIIPPGSSIHRIGNYAFENSSLTNIEINTNQSITIQIETFKNCSYLKKIIINSSQSLILTNNCFNKSTIEEFEANCNQLEICDNCFSYSKDFCSLKIASKEKLKIGQNIFSNCFSIKTISIENESNEDLILSAKSFENCNSLINLKIQNKSRLIFEERSFYNSFGTVNTNMNVESQTSIEFKYRSFEESHVEMIYIKSKEVHIREESFARCFNLTKYDINDSIEVSIEKYAFKHCSNLTSISFNKISYFKIRLNALFGCNRLDKIQLNLAQSFKSSIYYKSKGTLQKSNLSRIDLFIKKETKETEEKYIAKVFMKRNSNEPWDKYYIEYLAYFLDQIIKISKENIPMISDFFECGLFGFGHKPYFTIISKYFDNRSLSNLISELSGTQKYIILLGTAIGMQYIESKKISHQLLTSDKILLDESCCPHLNILDSPELEQVKSNDIKSDVYSFLLVLYELLTDYRLKSTHNLDQDIKVKQIKSERIQQYIENLRKHLSYKHYKGPTFTEILDEITYVNYLHYFEAKNEIFKYLDLFKIDIKEELVYKGIHYSISNLSKNAKVIKISDKNNINIQKNLYYYNNLYSVVEINDEVFSKINQSERIKLNIPNSIIKIGNKCFEQFANLYKINFSSPYLNIGYKCFFKCESLEEITFNIAETLIFGSKSFKGCEKLQQISFSESNRIEFGSNCFESCDSLKSFSCNASNILFQSQPFNKCNKLENFSITCERISFTEYTNEIFEDNFFTDFSLLKNVEINSAQEITISTNAFYGCNSLTKVKLKSSSSVTLLNKKRCSLNTQSFKVIGNQVNLDKNCFSSSKKLQSLKIKCSELNVDDQCFINCTDLSYASFNVIKKTKFGSKVFCNCSNLQKFYHNLNLYSSESLIIEQLDIGDYCFLNCKIIECLYFGKIQNTKIGSYAFEGCDSMTRFNMNASLNLEIGDYCFLNDKKLVQVNLSAENLNAGDYLFKNCTSILHVSLNGFKNKNIGKNPR